MTRRRLPIGIQTFRRIREEDCYYVDKTDYARRLVDEGMHYFLSRPRRFGKSLFVDTLKELFEGDETVFSGLAVHDHWDWSVRHPVLRLSFGGGHFREPGGLRANVMAQLDEVEREAGVVSDCTTAPERFGALTAALHRRAGRGVVVLVDEYDKPILDALDVPETARANRDFLRGLYAVIKDADAHVRFTFLTGVSRSPQRGCARGNPSHETASKVSLFSGLNNLTDITLEPAYSAVCGYTDRDLDTVFAPELTGSTARPSATGTTATVGSAPSGSTTPSTSCFSFRRRKFDAYWFETGTPTFLVETLFERRVSSIALGEMVAGSDLLSAFDVDDMATEALLFQTGYLTIKGEEDLGGEPVYRLGYPNREVRQSLNRSLLRHLVRDSSTQTRNSVRLYRLLESHDAEGLRSLFHAFFAGIPHEWYANNDIARYEGYYASVFYSYFAALRLDVTVEDSSSHGRLDMAVRCGGHVYLFEFKVVELAREGTAMAQLKARRYADKYRDLGEPIHLVGVEFSRETRNVVAFEVERA